MKIEVWYDYVCPFCYLGKRHLEMALSQLPEGSDISIINRSFELNSNQPLYSGKSVHEVLSSKYNMTIEDARIANERVGIEAAKVGLTYSFDEMKMTNTFDAHRLTQYAKMEGKEHIVIEKIYVAYFTEGRLISDKETLMQIAISSGLNSDKVKELLVNNEIMKDEVRKDESDAKRLAVQGVPFFYINQRYKLSGAQPVSVFLETMKKALDEEVQQ